MPDVYHDVPINGSLEEVYECVSTPDGLSKWWPKSATGEPAIGNTYELDFGPGYQWQAVVTEHQPGKAFAIRMTRSDEDWDGTTVSFELESLDENVVLHFAHEDWPYDNPHYRSSAFCWAMYLRCLKVYVEKGVELDYERRFEGE